jgi:hypothetical protein
MMEKREERAAVNNLSGTNSSGNPDEQDANALDAIHFFQKILATRDPCGV